MNALRLAIPQPRYSAYARGFSMIEALVALVVLAVGMLGVASLFITTVQANSSAISRMQAVYLASDLSDRIRANAAGLSAYDTGETTAEYTGSDAKNCYVSSASCTATELAQYDLYDWDRQVANSLPGTGDNRATGAIAYTAGLPAVFVITVSWVEPGQDVEDRLNYSLRMEL